MVLGIVWKGANRAGAVSGMLAGLGVTVFYMFINAPFLRAAWGLDPQSVLWFGIQPISAGVFGVPVGFLVTAVVSALTPSLPQSSPNRVPSDTYPGL
jgi:cation/acetate symporter